MEKTLRLRLNIVIGVWIKEKNDSCGFKIQSKEESVSRAMDKWKQRVREVYSPWCLCLSI